MKLRYDQLQIGQLLRTIVQTRKVDRWNNDLRIYQPATEQNYLRVNTKFSSWYLPEDTILKVISKNKGKRTIFELQNEVTAFSTAYNNRNNPTQIFPVGTKVEVFFPSDLKSFAKEEGEIVEADPNTVEKRFKIFYKGKPYKPKYFSDMGKVKASLLIAFGYYNNQYEMFQKYVDRNPELQDNEIPEWFSYGNDFKRSDCKDIEIMAFINGQRKDPVKEDFDVTKYYDQSMRLINVTAQFGSAARELYKKTMETGDYQYMLVFFPEEYRTVSKDKYGYCNFDFNALKESQRIKDIIKESGVKDFKKSTKHGKTAIVVKNLEDLKSIMLRLEPKEYFILDCDGDQLAEKNTRFVKLIMLEEAAKENA
jgi:hypothetical protein